MQKFHSGEKVRHKVGGQIMVVVDYQMDTHLDIVGPKSPFNTQKLKTIKTPSEKLTCEWVDENNKPQQAIFHQDTLDLIS